MALTSLLTSSIAFGYSETPQLTLAPTQGCSSSPTSLPLPFPTKSTPIPTGPAAPVDLSVALTKDIGILNRCLVLSANSTMRTRTEDDSTTLEIPAVAVDQFLQSLRRDLPEPSLTVPRSPSNSPPQISFLELNFLVTASIEGPAFDVALRGGAAQQSLLPGMTTTWNWGVWPASSGQQSLQTTTLLHISTNDGKEAWDRNLDSKNVSIQVSGDIVDPFARLAQWISRTPSALGAVFTAVAALIGGVFALLAAVIGIRGLTARSGPKPDAVNAGGAPEAAPAPTPVATKPGGRRKQVKSREPKPPLHRS
jgi:hypothetical protein